jgi:hypothetical protein
VLGGSVVDHLASQGSPAYEREKDRLIAINAGSNTITVRAVNGYRLLRRQVVPTLGSFRSPWRRTATSPTCREQSSPAWRAWRCSTWRARWRCWGTVPQARLAESGAPPCEGDRSDRQCRGAEAVQRGALLILIRIPVYVRAAHGGAPRGTDRGNDEH